MCRKASFALAPLLLAITVRGFAFEPLNGVFIAGSPCPALQSIKLSSNPGSIVLDAGKPYPVLGLNAPKGGFVQIKVAGAQPVLRWVAVSCGELRVGSGVEPEVADPERYLLAVGWQPAFCESKPEKTECRTQTPQRFDATHFALHGLWPQPEGKAYCGVPNTVRDTSGRGQWERLPEPELAAETLARLARVMPGVASYLHRHEFAKHGSCFPGNAERYFRVSLHLLDQLNSSHLQTLAAHNVGQPLTAQRLREAFEASFGAGAGKALEVRCVNDTDSRRRLIGEMRVALKGPLTDTGRLADMLDTAAPRSGNCDDGIVDPAGTAGTE